jgi:hypothetical protein
MSFLLSAVVFWSLGKWRGGQTTFFSWADNYLMEYWINWLMSATFRQAIWISSGKYARRCQCLLLCAGGI